MNIKIPLALLRLNCKEVVSYLFSMTKEVGNKEIETNFLLAGIAEHKLIQKLCPIH